MSKAQNWARSKDGIRLGFKGINTTLPIDHKPDGKVPYAQNVRAYKGEQTVSRATQGGAMLQIPGGGIHSLRRLNDTTPAGPASGYAMVTQAGTSLFLNQDNVDTGYSGNQVSMIPFRPASSPQPWMYVADSLRMSKVRSDGTCYKMGIMEPQIAPVIGTASTTITGTVAVLGSTRPWSNVSGQNPTFNYSDNGNGAGPTVIAAPIYGSTVTLTAAGQVNVGGTAYNAGDPGPSGSQNPGQFAAAPTILLGAWTDVDGNVVTGASVPAVFPVGAGTVVTVPLGAVQLQLGIDGTGGAFLANLGQFTVNYSITTSAVATVVSTIGLITAYYWGDSPHSGPVGSYIWKNPNDTSGSGIVRTTSTAAGSTSGNSFLFDTTPSDSSQPVQWQQLNQDGTDGALTVLFQPALEPAGYADFNVCIVGSIFVPAAATYEFTIVNKDNLIWGIGNNATWANKGSITGTADQSMTVVSQLPLLPYAAPDSEGPAQTTTVAITFPGPGVYPIEIDWDYWDKTGRTLTLEVNDAQIPPLSNTVLEGVQYRYVFRSSKTGATSNPSPESAEQQVPAISNTITPTFSTDPQVDKVDYYRLDDTLDNYTYVGTGPNTNPPTSFTDSLGDADISSNPLLQFDNFEPFPSIDLPAGGVVNVIGGQVILVSGTPFNTRWLGGTIINVGGIAYTLLNRPTSTTQLLAIDAADGLGLTYEIEEPILAAQPMASMFGNSDNAQYAFAIGDSLRPGTVYFCKGNNLDSAPDTNQVDITSPSDILVNGCIENGIGFVMSAENGWSIYPNFSQALATVVGVEGTPFQFVRSQITRGLYIRPCICTDGSGRFFWRSKSGIEIASGGAEQQSLTDADIYNLFPHENYDPTQFQFQIGASGFVIWPPDDSRPEKQSLSWQSGYLYYDYQDVNGVSRTLVYDEAAGGWVVDVYQVPAVIHSLGEGPNINTVYLGCNDGSIRTLGSGNNEVGIAALLTPAVNAGDLRAQKTVGDVFCRAMVPTNQTVEVEIWQDFYTKEIQGYTPPSMTGQPPTAGQFVGYVFDFSEGQGTQLYDIEIVFTWPVAQNTATGVILDAWQPNFTEQPEGTNNRPSDWDEFLDGECAFVQGLLLEADTSNVPKTIYVQNADDMTSHPPDTNPVKFNGQSIQALTFTPPFIGHSGRIVTNDGVPWRFGQGWRIKWVAQPYPELVAEYQTEPTSNGMKSWQTITEFNLAYISTTIITFTMIFGAEGWPSALSYELPSSNGVFMKGPNMPVAPNKFKLVTYRVSGAQPGFRLFKNMCEVKVGMFSRQSPFEIKNPFGAQSSDLALL